MKDQVIICVDDESTVLKSLSREILAALGEEYYLEIAESGQEAHASRLVPNRAVADLFVPVSRSGCNRPAEIVHGSIRTVRDGSTVSMPGRCRTDGPRRPFRRIWKHPCDWQACGSTEESF